MSIGTKKVCIFVDGENLRHSICDLFPSFRESSYLPQAEWTSFFDWVAQQAMPEQTIERVRTYWYVIQKIDFFPYNLSQLRKDPMKLPGIVSKNEKYSKRINDVADQQEKSEVIQVIINELENTQNTMQKRFDGWTKVQDSISEKYDAIEFRRAGSIKYNLLDKSLGSEKAVDVKLATDLILLKDIFDVAVVVSGDQDYVPAVDAIKNFGKHTVNVAFLQQDNKLLPGGAMRLNQATDRNIALGYSDIKEKLEIQDDQKITSPIALQHLKPRVPNRFQQSTK